MNPDGSISSLHPTPCVSPDLLGQIHSWRKSGATKDDVLDRLRMKCVPTGYTPHPWSSGMCVIALNFITDKLFQ